MTEGGQVTPAEPRIRFQHEATKAQMSTRSIVSTPPWRENRRANYQFQVYLHPER
jgi:hypothetical protein